MTPFPVLRCSVHSRVTRAWIHPASRETIHEKSGLVALRSTRNSVSWWVRSLKKNEGTTSKGSKQKVAQANKESYLERTGGLITKRLQSEGGRLPLNATASPRPEPPASGSWRSGTQVVGGLMRKQHSSKLHLVKFRAVFGSTRQYYRGKTAVRGNNRDSII